MMPVGKGIVLLAVVAFVSAGFVMAGAARSRGVAKEATVLVRDFDPEGELGEPGLQNAILHGDSEWMRLLGSERYAILREAGTERPGSGRYVSDMGSGFYVCGGCGLPLFHAEGKFASACGWPSFFRPVARENIAERRDLSNGTVRTEIVCARCGGHLGHVFEDGPRPTGLRYCVNSASLDFRPKSAHPPAKTDTAVFAAGCFWGVEKLFHETPGVLATRVGYSGGHVDRPTYRQVCSGATGHAEAVEVVFDPVRATYAGLVRLFFLNHDPTTVDRQGPDEGSQYRSVVFFRSAAQRAEAERVRDSLVEAKTWTDPVVTRFESAATFWPAEDYHQKYFLTHPLQCHPRRR